PASLSDIYTLSLHDALPILRMPMGIRASDPSRAGTAMSKAVSEAVNCRDSRKRGAMAPINPHAAKQTINEAVPSVMCRWFSIFRSEEHTSELQSRSDLVCRL